MLEKFQIIWNCTTYGKKMQWVDKVDKKAYHKLVLGISHLLHKNFKIKIEQ